MAAHRYWRIYITTLQAIRNGGGPSAINLNDISMSSTGSSINLVVPSAVPYGAVLASASSYKTSYTFLASSWLSNDATLPCWWMYDFTVPVEINSVSMSSPSLYGFAGPEQFQLQWSDDNITYTIAQAFVPALWDTTIQKLFVSLPSFSIVRPGTSVQQIVNSCINELSQVPGSSTQIYAIDRVLQYVQDAFDFCFQAIWWEAYRSFWVGTLDGSTGRLTTDIVPTTPVYNIPIITHTNIRSCFADGDPTVIRVLPPRSNPFLIDQASGGGSPIYSSPDYTVPNRPIRFYPSTATGKVVLEVRQEPLHPFALTDIVYLDQLMLILGACYMYAVDDATNPGQINKFQSMFMKRLSDMIAAENDTPIQLDSRLRSSVNQWTEL